MNEAKKSLCKGLAVYAAFALAFWTPLYYLVRVKGFSENIALIASGIASVPLIFLFVPALKNLLERITSVKIKSVEIGFRKAIEESVSSFPPEQIKLSIDPDRQVMYGKADLKVFTDTVQKYLPNPTTRLVILIDLKDGETVYLPMLYFQIRHVFQLFDLRALLFVDTRHTEMERRILGTVPPIEALRLLDAQGGESYGHAYDLAVSRDKENDVNGDVEVSIRSTWETFLTHRQDNNWERNLTDSVFRNVFAIHLERNVLHYPIDDYYALMKCLDPFRRHLILVGREGAISVRTIDHLAREIARNAVRSVLLQMPPTGSNSSDFPSNRHG